MTNSKLRRCSLKRGFLLLLICSITALLILVHSNDEVWTLANISRISQNLENENNVFFIETSCMEKCESVTLNSRQACSIESAAMMNPQANIVIVFVTDLNRIEQSETIQSLMRYRNIKFYRLNLFEFVVDTPAEHFVWSLKLYNSKYLNNNVSNILRLLLLWR